MGDRADDVGNDAARVGVVLGEGYGGCIGVGLASGHVLVGGRDSSRRKGYGRCERERAAFRLRGGFAATTRILSLQLEAAGEKWLWEGGGGVSQEHRAQHTGNINTQQRLNNKFPTNKTKN